MRITKRQLLKIIREERQGYDDREDERLAALHGPAADHEQDYEDRRDDAEFERRHRQAHARDHQQAIRRIVRENTKRNRRGRR